MKSYKGIVAIVALLCIIDVSASMNRPRPSGAELSRGSGQKLDLTMDGILFQNSLGSDKYGVPYASKVNEMRYFNYSSRGFANLWMALKREVDKINADAFIDQTEKMIRLQNIINSYYSNLMKYYNYLS